MKSALKTIYHLEGAVRPCAVRWLSDKSIMVCRTSGTLELQPDYNDSHSYPYQTDFSVIRLQRIVESGSLLALGDRECEIISGSEKGFGKRPVTLPPNPGSTYTCVIPRFNQYLIATREGVLWLSSNGLSWTSPGKLSIREITVGSAISKQHYVFGSAHGELELVNLVRMDKRTSHHAHADAIQDLIVLDIEHIATVSRDMALRVWRISETFELLWSIPTLHAHFINCISRVGEEIWTGDSDGIIAVTSLKTRTKTVSFKAHSDAIRTLDVSQHGNNLLSLSDDATYSIYDTRSRNLIKRYGEERQYIRSGDFLFRHGQVRAAFGSTSGVLYHGVVEKGPFFKARPSNLSLRALRYLNETQILCGDQSGVLRVFDATSEQILVSARTGLGLTAIRINPRDLTVICGYRDGFIRIYLTTTIKALAEQPSLFPHAVGFLGHNLPLNPIAAETSPSPILARRIHDSIVGDLHPMHNGLLISCSDDHTIKTVFLDSLAVLKSISLDGTAVNNLLALQDLLLATTDGGTIFVLDRNAQEIKKHYSEHVHPVRAISQISDSVVATGDRGGEVRIWNAHTLATVSVNRFQERIIELGYDSASLRLYVITEAEVGHLQLDDTWLLPSITMESASASKDVVALLSDKLTRTATSNSLQKDIEITKMANPFQLSSVEDQMIRKFTQWRRGTRCELTLLSGGLSEARVFRASIFDQSGASRINAVAKIGSRDAINNEAKQYDTEVARLSQDATPRRLDAPDFADEHSAAVFYSLADGYERSEFQVAVETPTMVSTIVNHLARLTAPWRHRVPERMTTIGEIRRHYVDDSALTRLVETYSMDWLSDFEKRAVQVKWCTIHGDLHGGNVLVNRDAVPLIIDYGNVGEGIAAFDPVSLELSHLFHPDGPLCKSSWPNADQAKLWMTPHYLVDCPLPDISSACWRWANSVCAGQREIAATAYAYLVLQLGYADTNKARALHLLEGVKHFLDKNT